MGLRQMELTNVTMFTFCSCYYTKEITCFKQNINCDALRDFKKILKHIIAISRPLKRFREISKTIFSKTPRLSFRTLMILFIWLIKTINYNRGLFIVSRIIETGQRLRKISPFPTPNINPIIRQDRLKNLDV